ncbi:MAG: STAS domain-containing protein [Mycolicibacterium neoaurum]|uniref:STAS domain-containing protein n=1 Tax=Mycolicibacterium neoaurum TaxID=1795 RepID=UPI002FF58321
MNTELTLHQTRTDAGTTALEAVGEIDLSNVEAFSAALETATAGTGGLVSVDLTHVTYLDSAAINALFRHVDHISILANRLLKAILTLSGLADLVTVQIVDA